MYGRWPIPSSDAWYIPAVTHGTHPTVKREKDTGGERLEQEPPGLIGDLGRFEPGSHLFYPVIPGYSCIKPG